jgi:hypothetical protein
MIIKKLRKSYSKNKYIIILYFLLFIAFKYIFNRNFFDIKIFIKSFESFETTENFPIVNKYYESFDLLKNNNINFFNFTPDLSKDVYLFYKIIILNYPKKFDKNSEFFFSLKNEEVNQNCLVVDNNKKHLKLIKCQN